MSIWNGNYQSPTWSGNNKTTPQLLYTSISTNSNYIGITRGNQVALPIDYPFLNITSISSQTINTSSLTGDYANSVSTLLGHFITTSTNTSNWAYYPADNPDGVDFAYYDAKNINNLQVNGGASFNNPTNSVVLNNKVYTGSANTYNVPSELKQYFKNIYFATNIYDLLNPLNYFCSQTNEFQMRTSGIAIPTGVIEAYPKNYTITTPSPNFPFTQSYNYRGGAYFGTKQSPAAYIRMNWDNITTTLPNTSALVEINADTQFDPTGLIVGGGPSRFTASAGVGQSLNTFSNIITTGYSQLVPPFTFYNVNCIQQIAPLGTAGGGITTNIVNGGRLGSRNDLVATGVKSFFSYGTEVNVYSTDLNYIYSSGDTYLGYAGSVPRYGSNLPQLTHVYNLRDIRGADGTGADLLNINSVQAYSSNSFIKNFKYLIGYSENFQYNNQYIPVLSPIYSTFTLTTSNISSVHYSTFNASTFSTITYSNYYFSTTSYYSSILTNIANVSSIPSSIHNFAYNPNYILGVSTTLSSFIFSGQIGDFSTIQANTINAETLNINEVQTSNVSTIVLTAHEVYTSYLGNPNPLVPTQIKVNNALDLQNNNISNVSYFNSSNISSIEITTNEIYTNFLGHPNPLVPTPIRVNNALDLQENNIFNVNLLSTTANVSFINATNIQGYIDISNNNNVLLSYYGSFSTPSILSFFSSALHFNNTAYLTEIYGNIITMNNALTHYNARNNTSTIDILELYSTINKVFIAIDVSNNFITSNLVSYDWAMTPAITDVSLGNNNLFSTNSIQLTNANPIYFDLSENAIALHNDLDLSGNTAFVRTLEARTSVLTDNLAVYSQPSILVQGNLDFNIAYSIKNTIDISNNNNILTSSITTKAIQFQDLSGVSTINTSYLNTTALYDSNGLYLNAYAMNADNRPFLLRDISNNQSLLIGDIVGGGNLSVSSFINMTEIDPGGFGDINQIFNSNGLLCYNSFRGSNYVASDWSNIISNDINFQQYNVYGINNLSNNASFYSIPNTSDFMEFRYYNGYFCYSNTFIPVASDWYKLMPSATTINYSNNSFSNVGAIFTNGSIVGNVGNGTELNEFPTLVFSGTNTANPNYIAYPLSGNRIQYRVGTSGLQNIANLNDIPTIPSTITYISSTTLSTNRTIANATSNIVLYSNISLANGTYNIEYWYNAVNHNNNTFSIVTQLSNSTRGIIFYDSNAGANITTAYYGKSGITSIYSTANYTFQIQVISGVGNTTVLSNLTCVISKLPI